LSKENPFKPLVFYLKFVVIKLLKPLVFYLKFVVIKLLKNFNSLLLHIKAYFKATIGIVQ